jgi:hypothetical protein
MPEQFITQFTQVLPKVLIIGDDSSLSLEIAQLFRQRGFKVVYYHYGRLLNNPSLQQKFHKNHYYKIIYFFNIASNIQTPKIVTRLLKNRREPTLFITRFDTTTDLESPETKLWFKASLTQYQNLVALAELFPRASLLIAHDLILADSNFHPAAAYIFSRLPRGELVNPHLNFSFISQKNFLSQITNLLFSPYTGEKILFQPDVIPAARVFYTFANVFSPPVSVFSQKLPLAEFEFPFPLTIYSGASDLDFAHPQARFFATANPPPPVLFLQDTF